MADLTKTLASRLPQPVRRRLRRLRRPRPQEQRTPVPQQPERSRLETRRDMVFASARRDGRFLEIGPAHHAILPKREGFDTRTVDYLDRAGLVDKYADFEHYDPDSIEEVDYVLSPDGTMLKEIDERFDLVLASHVLEHTTSLIDFLNECTGLLAEGGVLALVVPDHRYTFDRFRERSSLGRVIDTSIAPPRVHTVGTLTEFALNAVRHGSTGSWSAGHQGKYRLMHDLVKVREVAAQADGEYVDVHNWIFSPHHLRLLVEDLHALGYTTLRECFFADTVGHEFFLNLRVDGPGPGLTREQLLARSDRERRVDRPVFGRRA
ncbi:bifunctional 2-polyprenyl-6-hydroxyphenol methylase/3-demethylubiquinol 3-O-methyltransferase UbiG [uncultured Nocardioides sp.]|uniref:Methyltransferase type 11 domain-containing protein n=1 Tax=uncultured Nocardioides sp. TaxID=198441 RepID=A0A6J4N337_9ACTN|nr:methyltransferase domain-containing protein [uncultured Nocardioides sp.]CAA9375009.1 MAG: hypothetical protein AVDCRST_MAG06-402 [uncultured Nocardioides sp.]